MHKDKSLTDYKFVVSFALSKGDLDSMRSYSDDDKSYNRRVMNHVKQELCKRIAAQMVNVLDETIEPVNAEGGNKEWKLEVIAIPYDVLVNMLEVDG